MDLGPVGEDECVRIFTGAVMPPDCDTVAMQERVTVDDAGVHLPNDLKRGQNRRFRGEDLKTGAVALPNLPAAIGLDLVAQALFVDAMSPLGFDAGDATWWSLGN